MTAPAPLRPPPPQPVAESPLEQQMATFIGPRWTTYRRKFRPFAEDGRFQPTWNWAAAVFSIGGIWFLYRKLYLPFAFFWFAPGIVFQLLWGGELPTSADPAKMEDASLLLLGIQLSTMILAGGTANYLLWRRGRAAIALVNALPAIGDRAPRLARVGGVNRIGASILVAVVVVLAMATVAQQYGGAIR